MREHDIVELIEQFERWPAGTRATVMQVPVDGMVLVEVGPDPANPTSDYEQLDVPASDLRIVRRDPAATINDLHDDTIEWLRARGHDPASVEEAIAALRTEMSPLAENQARQILFGGFPDVLPVDRPA